MPNLAEIAQGRQVPLSAGIFEAVNTQAKTLMSLDARTSADTKFQTLALVGLPTAGGFVDYGEGFGNGTASLALREFDAKLAGGMVEVERITANRWDAAHPNAGTTYFDLQVMARMVTEMKHLNKQLYYGTANDAKGFPGMKELTPLATGNVLSLTDDPGADDYVKTVINAGGTTSSTASSVYAVYEGPLDCQLVVCNDGGGELFTASDVITQMIAPDANQPTKKSLHDTMQIHGFFGLAVSGMNQTPNNVVPTQYALRRLANVTEDSGKGVTDAKLEALVLSFGDGKLPTKIFMNGRSGRQLADSRSASNVTLFLGGGGDARNNTASVRAARPTNFEGIPIVYDSAIRSTDAIESV